METIKWEDMTGQEQYKICRAMIIRAANRLHALDRLPELRELLVHHDLDEFIAECWADTTQSKHANDPDVSASLRVYYAASNALVRLHRQDKRNSSAHAEYIDALNQHAEPFEPLAELQVSLEYTDAKNRDIILQRLTGATLTEIALVLGISQQAVSKRLCKLAKAV